MKKTFMFVSPVLNLTNPAHQLLIAEQEKALRKVEFEMARHRLMVATNRVQELNAIIYYNRKEVCNG